jgi:peroxiredoxin
MLMSNARVRAGVSVLLLSVLIAPIAGCSSAQSGSSSGSETNFVAGDGSIEVVPVAQRVAAPDFTLPTLSGGNISLGKQLGKVVVLNVWASWCAPCRKEAPDLQAVWEQSDKKSVQFIGLDTRDSTTSAQGFIKNYGITYPQAVDTDGQVQLLFRNSLPAQAIPSTLIVDAQGRVAARILGTASEATLRNVIDDVQSSTS